MANRGPTCISRRRKRKTAKFAKPQEQVPNPSFPLSFSALSKYRECREETLRAGPARGTVEQNGTFWNERQKVSSATPAGMQHHDATVCNIGNGCCPEDVAKCRTLSHWRKDTIRLPASKSGSMNVRGSAANSGDLWVSPQRTQGKSHTPASAFRSRARAMPRSLKRKRRENMATKQSRVCVVHNVLDSACVAFACASASSGFADVFVERNFKTCAASGEKSECCRTWHVHLE
jgi:hypothetical protein